MEELHRYAGDASNLKSAVRHGAEALALCEAENIVCPAVWVFNAIILEAHFEHTSDSKDLRSAELLCREALPLCDTAHPLNATICLILGSIVLRRCQETGDIILIEEAVGLQQDGLNRLHQTKSHMKHRHLRGLAGALAFQRSRGGNQNPDQPLSVISEAMQLCPTTHVDRWTIQFFLLQQLYTAYHRSGTIEYLDSAIELGRQALSEAEVLSLSLRSFYLDGVAHMLRARYETSKTDDKDIEESIELHRQSLRISTRGHVHEWTSQWGLAQSLVVQFRLNGDLGHLEEASQRYRHIVNVLPSSHPGWSAAIATLAQCLSLRGKETGDITDLNQALEMDREAVAGSHISFGNRLEATTQMVSHLCSRFEMLGGSEDLDEAISLSEEILKSLSDGDINRPEVIYLLSKARFLRGTCRNDSEDIDMAIEVLSPMRRLLSESGNGPERLRTLASCHLVRFRQSSDVHHALCAKDIISDLLRDIIPGHYERFQCLISAAEIYMEPGTPYFSVDIVLEHLGDALEASHRDVRSKIRGAKQILHKMETQQRDLFTTASPNSMSLLNIMTKAVALLPRVAFFGIHPLSRLQSLGEGQSIALTGASQALNMSLPETALEILEQGRAVFWTHTLRMRSPFDNVPKDIQGRLVSLARRLEKVTGTSDKSMDQQAVEREIAQRRQQSEEFNSLVENVRCLPGLERFMLHDQYSTLAKAAEKGPIAVLVSSAVDCHAIVLNSFGQAVHILLKEVTDKWLMESASIWRSTVIEARAAIRDSRKLVKAKKAVGSRQAEAERILRLLWTNIVSPVFEVLRFKVGIPMSWVKYQHLFACSRHSTVIVLGSGGVQPDASHISQSMPLVQTASGAQTMSYLPIFRQSAASFPRERGTSR
jgi:tetratricopeptide (TPR) repeat protein